MANTDIADFTQAGGGLYDFTKPEEGYERAADGLTPELVREISAKKN